MDEAFMDEIEFSEGERAADCLSSAIAFAPDQMDRSAVVQERIVLHWSAKIPPQEMAMHMVGDLCKKFRQLEVMPPEKIEIIAQGLVDGLKGTTFKHPGGCGIPDYRRSMNPDYCAGFEVGNTWRRIAMEWPEAKYSLPNT